MKKYISILYLFLLTSCTTPTESSVPQQPAQDDHIFIEESFDYLLFNEMITSSEKWSLKDANEETIMPNHSRWSYKYMEDPFELLYVKTDENDVVNYNLYLREKGDSIHTTNASYISALVIYTDDGYLSQEVFIDTNGKTIAASMERENGNPVDCGVFIQADNITRDYCNDNEKKIIMQQQEELSDQLNKLLKDLGLDVDELGINFY